MLFSTNVVKNPPQHYFYIVGLSEICNWQHCFRLRDLPALFILLFVFKTLMKDDIVHSMHLFSLELHVDRNIQAQEPVASIGGNPFAQKHFLYIVLLFPNRNLGVASVRQVLNEVMLMFFRSKCNSLLPLEEALQFSPLLYSCDDLYY